MEPSLYRFEKQTLHRRSVTTDRDRVLDDEFTHEITACWLARALRVVDDFGSLASKRNAWIEIVAWLWDHTRRDGLLHDLRGASAAGKQSPFDLARASRGWIACACGALASVVDVFVEHDSIPGPGFRTSQIALVHDARFELRVCRTAPVRRAVRQGFVAGTYSTDRDVRTAIPSFGHRQISSSLGA